MGGMPKWGAVDLLHRSRAGTVNGYTESSNANGIIDPKTTATA